MSRPEAELEILDDCVRAAGLGSRSAGLQRAVRMLRWPDLEQDYEAAWHEWFESGGDEMWRPTVADGVEALDGAAR